jgi:hypothetical protein
MVSVLAMGAVNHGFEPRSGQTKDYNIGICCLSAKHASFKRKSKDCWVGIRIMCPSGRHVYPRTVVSVCYHHKNPTKRVGLVQSGPHHYFIDIAEKLLSWR